MPPQNPFGPAGSGSRPAGGAAGSWDGPVDPQLPIPPGLQPGNEPSETAIPRAIDAAAERIPTSVPQIFKNALSPSFGEGSEFERPAENKEHTFSSMGNALRTSLGENKKAWTSKEGLKNTGKEIGSQAVSTLTSLQPKKYAQQLEAGDYAGAGAGLAADAAQTAIALGAHEPGGRLVGEHPAIGQAAMEEHLRSGGSTFDPRSGKNLAGSNNWAVSVAPEHTVVSNSPFTPEQYNSFVAQHRELLARNPNLNVGTWADGSGLHYLDLTATTPNKQAAVQMAGQLNQKAIYHLGRGEELATGGTGEPVQSPFSVDYRAQALAAASPEKKPFSGYHLSNDKLDYLDPNRRGLVQKTGLPAGQESARLNLQTDTGVGQNAPGGFYAYTAGTRAEPSIAGRKYSHEVRGHFAMADITDPKWQDAGQAAYQDALQKTGNATVAQYASANAMEHAIRDAGFDGYTAKGSGINFFFNGQPTQLIGAGAKAVELPLGKLSSEAGLVRGAEQRKGLGSAPAETGQAPDPWANLQYDRQALDQAKAEQSAGRLPQGTTLVQRAQQLKEQLMSGEQGGHAGNGVASEEELNRPGKNFMIDRNGRLTFHGRSFAPEETPAGGAHVSVMDDGQYRLNEGVELNPAQKNALASAARELGIKNLRPQGEQASLNLREASNDFNQQRGAGPINTSHVDVDPRVDRIADAFDSMKHSPNDPQTKASYSALIRDIRSQWNYATKKLGIQIEPSNKDPYGLTGDTPAAQELFNDVTQNKHLGVWRGGNPLPKDHPLAQIDPQTGETYNTMLRAVHDIFGHAAEGHDFGERGEENAWNLHGQMFSKEAIPALTTETKGQTSWFFHNKDVRGGKSVGTFAEQKAGLLPEWAHNRQTGASFAGENPASVQNGDPLSLLTDKERDQAMSKRLGNQFTKILRQLPEVSDFEAAARKGASGRTWYQRSVDAFDAMRKLAPDYFKPEDADRFANVLAATSPQQGVPLNLREALTFWKDWNDAGRPQTISEIQKAMRNGDIRPLTNQPSKLGNVVLALNDHDILSKTINKGQIEERNKYFKVGNFGKNLTKSFGNVTLDSWMGAFAGVNEQDMAKPQFYHALALRTRQAAQKLGFNAAETQAAIWTFTKTLAEMSGWKAAGGKYYRPTEMLDRLTPDKMKSYSQDFADIMKTDPEVRGKLSELGVDLNELDKRLKNVTPKGTGEALEGADQGSLARSLKRNAARIGRKQRELEGFTQYSKPPAQSELDLGEPEEGNTDFPFGGPLAEAIRAGGR